MCRNALWIRNGVSRLATDASNLASAGQSRGDLPKGWPRGVRPKTGEHVGSAETAVVGPLTHVDPWIQMIWMVPEQRSSQKYVNGIGFGPVRITILQTK